MRYGDDLRRYITQQFSRNRVLHEPNNLIMYADMIEALRDPILERMIVFDCVQIIREQLNSSGGGGDNSARVKERLRNIATFVGLLTMARDEPLTADYLDVKQELSLAVGSDNSARISLLVTIICHLLKHCEQSTVSNFCCLYVLALKAAFYWTFFSNKHIANISICSCVQFRYSKRSAHGQSA